MSELIYLDNAATTFPKPAEMHDAMDKFYRECGVNPGRSGSDLALHAEQMVLGTRRKLTEFLNGGAARAGRKKDPNRLVFTVNGTLALNLIVRGVVKPGDHVVTTTVEHNSVIRPVNHMVEMGAAATFVSPDEEGYLDPDDIRKALRKNTKLVIVNHGSNVTGVVQDLTAIGRVCREAGVAFAVDAAQTVGVVPIDMAESGIDFLAFTGHKGLFGPTGTGGLCVADDAEIASSVWGGTGVRSAEPLHLEKYPWRLEAGTLNLMGIAGLAAGLDWVLKQGVEAIHRREMELLDRLQRGLAEVRGVTLHGTRRLERRTPVLSFTVNEFEAGDVGTILDAEYNILTRTGLHCAPLLHDHMRTSPVGTVRFSIGPFNTAEHIDAAVRAVAEIAAERN